jgi:pilus assembly protein TadC
MHRDAATDSIDNVLDRISIMREELVAIEQALERIQAANREPSRNKEEAQ